MIRLRGTVLGGTQGGGIPGSSFTFSESMRFVACKTSKNLQQILDDALDGWLSAYKGKGNFYVDFNTGNLGLYAGTVLAVRLIHSMKFSHKDAAEKSYFTAKSIGTPTNCKIYLAGTPTATANQFDKLSPKLNTSIRFGSYTAGAILGISGSDFNALADEAGVTYQQFAEVLEKHIDPATHLANNLGRKAAQFLRSPSGQLSSGAIQFDDSEGILGTSPTDDSIGSGTITESIETYTVSNLLDSVTSLNRAQVAYFNQLTELLKKETPGSPSSFLTGLAQAILTGLSEGLVRAGISGVTPLVATVANSDRLLPALIEAGINMIEKLWGDDASQCCPSGSADFSQIVDVIANKNVAGLTAVDLADVLDEYFKTGSMNITEALVEPQVQVPFVMWDYL